MDFNKVYHMCREYDDLVLKRKRFEKIKLGKDLTWEDSFIFTEQDCTRILDFINYKINEIERVINNLCCVSKIREIK